MSEKQEELNSEEQVDNQESQETQEEVTSEEVAELSIEDKIAQLEAQLKESEDKYFRVHADFEKY